MGARGGEGKRGKTEKKTGGKCRRVEEIGGRNEKGLEPWGKFKKWGDIERRRSS